MQKTQIAKNVLGALCLLACASNAAWATDYSGTLDLTVTKVTVPFNGTPISAGVDVDRYDLGMVLSGAPAISFTAPAYNTAFSMLGILFTSDPNDALYANPTVLANLVTPGADFATVLGQAVKGIEAYAFGYNYIKPGVTTDVSALFGSSPLTFTAGTHYYAFVAGGSLDLNGAVFNPTMPYTLTVAAVPEPETYAMLLAGLGMVGAIARKRSKAAV